MKSEHRHELAENELAKLITRGLKRIEPYQNHILLVMLVITVLIVSGVMIMRSSTSGRSEGFAELLNCKTADDYLSVADTYQGQVAGHWARMRAGEEFLREGIRLSMTDRAQAVDRLEEAEEAFDTLLKNTSIATEVRVKALQGMAMTLESRGTDTEKAIEAYQALLDYLDFLDPSGKESDDASPESGEDGDAGSQEKYHPYAESRRFAEDRIEVLKTGRGQQFYAWFQAQNPSPEDRPLPRDFPDPFGDMFDDEPESDGLPPPPPAAHRYTPEVSAPEPPADAGEDDRPALSAPGTTDNDAPPPEQSDESTTDASPDPGDE